MKRPGELRDLLARAGDWWPDKSWRRCLDPLRARVGWLERPAAAVSATTDIPATDGPDAEAQRQTASVRIATLFYSGRTAEAYELACRLRPAVPLQGLTDEVALALWTAITLDTGERWGELDAGMTAALEAGVRVADHAAAGLAALGLGNLRFFGGRFIDAGRLLAEAELHFEHHDAIGMLAITRSMQVGVACFTADATEAAAALERCHAA